jgi:hypothetical protein
MTVSMAMVGALHCALLRGLMDHGVLSSRESLLARLQCSSAELDRAFEALADEHGVVLHPGSHRVWVIHPFSLAPTTFLVQSGDRTWWGNCAWCSLGIAALVGSCTITTTLGAEREQVQITIRDGEPSRPDLVVHFPIPMAQAWDNVIYTCSLMLMFGSERQVSEWCARHEIPQGDVQPIEKVMELARRWYGEHLRPDWRKRSVAEARALFEELGLTHPVWSLPDQEGRF